MKTEVSVFRNITDTAARTVPLEEVVAAMRQDAALRALTAAHRADPSRGLKQQCPLLAVAARMSGGKASRHVESMTGLGMVDVDHAGAAEVERLRALAVADAHTVLCHGTVSGEGLRVLFAYEVPSAPLAEQMAYYAKAFAHGNDYYARLLGAPTDLQCKNVTRLSVICHDAAAYYAPEATPFTVAEVTAAAATVKRQQQEERQRQRTLARIQARYEQTIRPEVEAEGAVYAPGSHNDYVMRVGYRLNQFGFQREAALQWAAQAFPDYAEAAGVVASCYATQPGEHASRGGPKRPRARSDDGEARAVAGVEEIRAFLDAHVRLRHNVVTGRVECCAVAAAEGGAWLPITDRVVNSLWSEMSRVQRVWVQDLYRVIESDYVAEYNPFVEYLEGTPPAVEGAIAELAATVTVRGGPAEQALFGEYLRKWMVAMVAAWVNPEVVNNVILVLIGEQGAYKTTWFQHLLPPELRRYFYTKTNAQRMGRDDLLMLSQCGLVCCEELDTMRQQELNQLKAAVTMMSIDERAAYAHFHEHRPHIASFCGTGNNVQFLSDPTGNRRWLPFEVAHIRSPRDHPLRHAAIYAEAYALYRSGFRYWFTREEILRLADHNRQFETPRLETELVQLYFRHPGPAEAGEFMSVARAMQIVGAGLTQKLSAVYLGRAFTELGFGQKRYNRTRGYIVALRSAEEMRGMQRTMACEAVDVEPRAGDG